MARLRFAARAGRSLRAHDDHLRARNPQAADRLLSEVERVAALLSENPFMGPRVASGRVSRCFVTRRYRYRIIDRAGEDEVVILDILHPRQNPPEDLP